MGSVCNSHHDVYINGMHMSLLYDAARLWLGLGGWVGRHPTHQSRVKVQIVGKHGNAFAFCPSL